MTSAHDIRIEHREEDIANKPTICMHVAAQPQQTAPRRSKETGCRTPVATDHGSYRG